MPKPVLSVFSPDLLAADRAAFVALVQHLAEADPEHVVVMVQVENEIGLLGDSRDRSPAADEAWDQQVPKELVAHLEERADRLGADLAELWGRSGRRTSGTWSEVFGDGWEAEEVFMAWAFGSYVEALAEAGKAVKDLPMYVNAWLGPQPGQSRAGEYPSGGPTSRVLDVWKAAAPSLDLLAPDIYVDDAQSAMAVYDRPDNPLFVPETRFRTGNLFWALGHHRAIGFSVFGIEDGRVDSQLARACALLGPMTRDIAAAQAEGRIAGILLDEATRRCPSGSAAWTSPHAGPATSSVACCSTPVSSPRRLRRPRPARPTERRGRPRRGTPGRSASSWPRGTTPSC